MYVCMHACIPQTVCYTLCGCCLENWEVRESVSVAAWGVCKNFGWNVAPAVARCRVCARVLVFVDSNTRATVLQNLGSAWGKHRCVDWWFAYVSWGSPCGFLVVFWWSWWLSWLWWWWYVVVFSITGNCRLCRKHRSQQNAGLCWDPNYVHEPRCQ